MEATAVFSAKSKCKRSQRLIKNNLESSNRVNRYNSQTKANGVRSKTRIRKEVEIAKRQRIEGKRRDKKEKRRRTEKNIRRRTKEKRGKSEVLSRNLSC